MMIKAKKAPNRSLRAVKMASADYIPRRRRIYILQSGRETPLHSSVGSVVSEG